jgi:hypothetical protein
MWNMSLTSSPLATLTPSAKAKDLAKMPFDPGSLTIMKSCPPRVDLPVVIPRLNPPKTSLERGSNSLTLALLDLSSKHSERADRFLITPVVSVPDRNLFLPDRSHLSLWG